MIMTNRLLPVALVAALIGGSVGALVMHSKNQPATETATVQSSFPQNAQSSLRGADAQFAQYPANTAGSEQFVPAGFNTAAEQTAYKSGFADGFRACDAGAAGARADNSSLQYSQPRVVYRNTT